MQFFHRLLGLDFPDGTELSAVEIALRGGLRLGTVVLLALLVIGVAVFFYRREAAELPRRRRVLFTVLRAVSLSLLVLLVARPALIAEGHGLRPRGVAILIDNSASLKQTDRRVTPIDLLRVAIAKGQAQPDANPDVFGEQSASKQEAAQITRLEMVRAVLNHPSVSIIGDFRQVGPLKAYLFGAKPRKVDIRGLDKTLTADEERTALFDALRDVATAPDGDPPGAIVVVTDGLDNASAATLDEVAAELKQLNVAVHVYGVGSTDSGAVRLVDATIPETIFADDVAGIPIRWRYRGLATATAIVGVTLNGKEIAHKEVPLIPGDGKDAITFTPEIKPGGPANADVAVTIRLKDDAAVADEVHKMVTLSERKVRVLIIDDAPRWEFKFLQPALSRDRRVEATYFVAQGDPRALGNEPFLPAFPSRDRLFGFDLVILGDVAPAVFGPDGIAALVDYVREGGGLAVIAGRKHMPADYADSPLAEVLPVEFVPVRFPPLAEERTSPFQSELTPAGRRASLLGLADTPQENEQAWKELPGFYWHYPVTKLRPGAVALLAHPRNLADDTPQPLLATQYYGKGPVLFLGADETWRWRYNSGDRIYARFWGQVVYQLGLPHLLGHASRVQMALDRSDAVVGRPGYVYARMFDNEYRPYLADRVPAILEPLDPPGPTRQMTLDPVPGRPGEYRALLPHDAPGRFELRVQQPETGAINYQVTLPAGHELEPAGLNEQQLRKLAADTGGAFYREEDLHRMAQNVTPKYAPFTVRQEVLMWGPAAWVLFVGLVTAEWIGRKLANLS
jgi:hypothetical protein